MVDINNYAPRSGRLIREDNTIINEANGINADGSRNVQLTGSETGGRKQDKRPEETFCIPILKQSWYGVK